MAQHDFGMFGSLGGKGNCTLTPTKFGAHVHLVPLIVNRTHIRPDIFSSLSIRLHLTRSEERFKSADWLADAPAIDAEKPAISSLLVPL